MNTEVLARFFSKVVKAESGCHEWQGCKRDGYGLFRAIKGKSMMNAHRYAWELENGQIPKNMQVLHQCDNRCCVRVSHLFLGTLQDNMRDRNKKGRQARGERAGRATLSERTVREIRMLHNGTRKTKWGELRELSNIFGVDRQVISNIIRGKTWGHI